jgi:hypothetical protein
VPIRWLLRYGWRVPTGVEVSAWTNVMRDMGAMMRIADMPTTFEGFCSLLDEYEAAHFVYRPANERVARATLDMMVSWYPAPLRPAMRMLVPGLLDDRTLRAVGLPEPGRRIRTVAERAMRARAGAVRRLPARRDHRPFEPRIRSYTDEPATRQLGPAALVKRREAS